MNFEITEDGITFAELDSLRGEFLRRLPQAAATDDEAAQRRIFPPPIAEANDDETSDWKEFVVPELRELFQSHVEVVTGDIAAMPDAETLLIPKAHAEAWIHTLNQARIAIGARHQVTEEDMEETLPTDNPGKLLALLQMDVYALFLSVLLDVTD